MKAYARAITAVTNVPQTLQSFDPPLEGVPNFTVENVIVGGAGKRARALWMLASVDARIRGESGSQAMTGQISRSFTPTWPRVGVVDTPVWGQMMR